MAEFVLDTGSENINNQNKQMQNNTHRSNSPRGNGISDLLADRYGNPPSQEELQRFQNRLMGRDPNFHKLPQAEKERILFQEMQGWHFQNMPSIETMKKEVAEHPLNYEVKSLESGDTKGYGNQHINILQENVRLTVVSDGKTLKFNNKELLEEYRNALNKEKELKKGASEVQQRGTIAHNTRVFED
jgi:hypothetical protein